VGGLIDVVSIGLSGLQRQLTEKGANIATMNLRRLVRRGYRRIPKIIRRALKLIATVAFAIGFDIGLLYFLGVLTSLNLIDWKTVFSFLAVEVLAVVIARLMGVGQESESEKRYRRLRMAAAKARLVPQYAHLTAPYVKNEESEPEYPESQYFIVNAESSTGYWAAPHIYDLVEEGVILRHTFDNESKLRQFLNDNKITISPRYPIADELRLLQKRKTKA
jgi:hypothetical protein